MAQLNSDNGDALPAFVQRAENGWYLTVRVQPGAKKSELAGEMDNALRIRLNAPAVENKANTALQAFVAKILGIRKSKVSIISGEKSRNKRILISPDFTPDWNALLKAGQ